MQKIALFTVDGGTQLDCATFGSFRLCCFYWKLFAVHCGF